MSKVVKIIRSHADRLKLVNWIMTAKDLTRVWLAEPKRSTEANDKMWAMLSDVQRQRPTLHGCKMNTDRWKAVFMMAAGQQVTMLPTLEGDGFFPYGHRSSELSVREMSDVIEQIIAYAAMEGIELSDPKTNATEQRAA
jgi:hypothetical protein